MLTRAEKSKYIHNLTSLRQKTHTLHTRFAAREVTGQIRKLRAQLQSGTDEECADLYADNLKTIESVLSELFSEEISAEERSRGLAVLDDI